MSIHLKAFFLSLFLSGIFSMGGTGGAAALVPTLNMIGIPFALSKATALFVSITATATSSLINIKRKIIDYGFTLPILFTMTLFLPAGSYISQYLNITIMKWLLAFFLLFSSFLILFNKKKQIINIKNKTLLIFITAIIALLSGILGISGGNLIIAFFVLSGYDSKKVAISASLIIPFSSSAGFAIYSHITKLDWNLIFICATAAIIGGILGNQIMHFKLKSSHIKKIIGLLLMAISVRLFYTLL